jgi:hypothetical protein
LRLFFSSGLVWDSLMDKERRAITPAMSEPIRQLNVDVLKAYNVGDVKTLDRIEDANFTLTGEFGEVAKAKQIDDVRHRPPNATSVNVMVANERFRFYGDAALPTEVERYGEGKDFPRFETTSLWVRRGEDWKLIHMHFSKLSE